MTPPLVALRDAPPSVDEAMAAVRHPGAGAVAVFVGVVRDHSHGEDGTRRAVAKLEYEAYAAMAEAEMRRIAAEVIAEIPGSRVAAIHRVGTLVVGDVAVVCAASAPHRAEAFRACRAMIDRLKARAPIWKRESGADGAYWVGWEDARCREEHEGGDRGARADEGHVGGLREPEGSRQRG